VAIAVSCSADRQALGKITAEGVFLEQLETDPAKYLPATAATQPADEDDVVRIDLRQPMEEILAELSRHPVKTRLSLSGPLVVARDIAHAKIKERLDAGEEMPAYLQGPRRLLRRPGQDARGLRVRVVRPDHGRPDGLLRRAVPGRRGLDGDAGQGQPVEGGDRGLRRARRLLPRLDRRPAARLAQDCIKSVEVLEYEELGMEAVWKIEVEDFPAFIVVDDKGNDFFTDPSGAVTVPITGIRVRSRER
jgi:fumarate hydratase class I